MTVIEHDGSLRDTFSDEEVTVNTSTPDGSRATPASTVRLRRSPAATAPDASASPTRGTARRAPVTAPDAV